MTSMDRSAGEDQLGPGTLNVFAAGSQQASIESLAAEWRRRRPLAVAVSYANARDLAQRIVDGEPADVFASASPEHPAALHARGLLDEPRPFATNRLVVAVRSDSDARDARVLAQSGSRVVIEVQGVPLGDYTRILVERLEELFGRGFARAVSGNVVSEEQTVGAVIDRLCSGQADVAVLYSTDVPPISGDVRAIEVPSGAAVQGTYVIATVRAGRQPDAANAWVDLIQGPMGEQVLRAAGFGPPHDVPSRSTTKTSVSSGPITPPAPRLP